VDLLSLAIVVGVGAVAALLAAPQQLRVPVVVAELAVGVLLGRTGFRVVNAHNTLLAQLASIGFAMVMLIAGSHVPVRDRRLRGAVGRGTLLVLVVAGISVVVAWGLSILGGISHVPLYAVLLASTSAAIVLPVLDGAGLATLAPADPRQGDVLVVMAQAAIADVLCIVALPLVADPHRAARAAMGGVAVAVSATAIWALLLVASRRGLLDRVHQLSVERNLGLELRLSLTLLLVLAGTAAHFGTSVMLAGFACGLVLSAIGEPRRLAAQLFAVSDGFLAPVFFVLLGAALDLRTLGSRPRLVALGICLGLGAILVHVVAGHLFRQPVDLSALAAAQLGVPVAAVTIGSASGLLKPGEGPAIIIGAIVTIIGTVVVNHRIGRQRVEQP
jgi:Kef-type K+ transport system membrane component KefB